MPDLDLNTSPNLPESDASYTGGSGDGNDLSMAALKRGYQKQAMPDNPPHFYPQNDDSGTTYVDPFDEPPGGIGRPQGWER